LKKEDRVIPRKSIPQGIEYCKRNIIEFLKDARMVINSGTLNHAYISVQFAVEELGKILMIRKKFLTDASDPVVVSWKVFASHEGKTEEASNLLGEGFMKVFDEGVWKKGMWKKGLWAEDTYVEHETRLDCAFVDYYADNWRIGRSINKELLVKLVERIEEKLPDA
jgi:AbiV family abortive infection protein